MALHREGPRPAASNLRRGAVAAALLGALAGGCSKATPTPCPADHQVAGLCAGVPLQAVCATDDCTAGVACDTVIHAATDADLAAALGTVKSGDCISLAPGTYGAAALPGGVSLLGRSPDDVHVAQIKVGAGKGAVVRGIEVTAGGIDVAAMAASVDLVAVRVSGSTGDAIHVGAGAAVKIDTSEVSAAKGSGIYAVDAASVDVLGTVITDSTGPGLHAACTGGCACAAPWAVTVTGSALRRNGLVGVSLVGVHATLNAVEVTDNAVGANFTPSGGMSASQCADLIAAGVKVLNNASFGVLVDGSSATLGQSGTDPSFEVNGNLIGLWIQGSGKTMPQPVVLDNCALAGNAGVGIGFAGEANGIIIHDSHVDGTTLQSMPSLTADGSPLGSSQVGDGLSWQGGAGAAIDGLSLSGSARQSVLITGSVGSGSSIANLALSSGDDQKGVVEQKFPTGGTAPTIGSGAPAIQKSAAGQFSIPAAPAAPAVP